MSDSIPAIIAALQWNNYLSLTVASAIVYDYIITLPSEINCIWNQPWSWVTVFFLVVRYVGLSTGVIEALYGSTFIPGPVSVKGMVLKVVQNWIFVPYIAAVELVMILRVYAMYRASRVVLGVLLLVYAPMIILLAIAAGYYNIPSRLSVTTPQVLDLSFCNATYTSSGFGPYVVIPRLVLAALMFIFAVVRFISESYQTYKATKQWVSNQYMQLLVRESIIYFFAHLVYITVTGIMSLQQNQGALLLAVEALSCILLFALSPRFIINVRELYLSDVHHRWRGETKVDTGFGFSGYRSNTTGYSGSEVGFAHVDARRAQAMQMAVLTTEY